MKLRVGIFYHFIPGWEKGLIFFDGFPCSSVLDNSRFLEVSSRFFGGHSMLFYVIYVIFLLATSAVPAYTQIVSDGACLRIGSTVDVAEV